jgi:hypothetical protein
LAKNHIQGTLHYTIRESYRVGDSMRSRDLFELGSDPSQYIVYPGGNSFYIHEDVREALADRGCDPSDPELDQIFWRFLKPRIRRALESFRNRELNYHRSKRTGRREKGGPYHFFDRRRLYFLKTGRAQPSGSIRIPDRFFSRLDHKSRDEIEQNFIEMERHLHVREVKTYAYSIFDVQSFFQESYANTIPEFLNQAELDRYFVEELCSLNDDPVFWGGMQPHANLHEYLVRYAVMFFDYDFQPRDFMADYLRRFINSRKGYRPPQSGGRKSVSLTEAGKIFGVDSSQLQEMARADLARLFRRKALKLHPDKGGRHESFIKLIDAYHSLMRGKRK